MEELEEAEREMGRGKGKEKREGVGKGREEGRKGMHSTKNQRHAQPPMRTRETSLLPVRVGELGHMLWEFSFSFTPIIQRIRGSGKRLITEISSRHNIFMFTN